MRNADSGSRVQTVVRIGQYWHVNAHSVPPGTGKGWLVHTKSGKVGVVSDVIYPSDKIALMKPGFVSDHALLVVKGMELGKALSTAEHCTTGSCVYYSFADATDHGSDITINAATLSGGYHNAPTKVGDCGSPFMQSNHVVAIHAGNDVSRNLNYAALAHKVLPELQGSSPFRYVFLRPL
jgi:hypothetical protein